VSRQLDRITESIFERSFVIHKRTSEPTCKDNMRFHILGIPHTVTSRDYVACAYTQKVWKFGKMMTDRGHEVYHYGHEESDLQCTEHVPVTTNADLEIAYGSYDWRKNFFKYDTNDHAYQTFYKNAIREVGKRKQPNDFILPFWGAPTRPVCDAHPDLICVEPGIGYAGGHWANYKVFESYAIYHAYYGLEAVGICKQGFYDVVIPNYFDPDDFTYAPETKEDYCLFLGRVYEGKGIHIAIQVTKEAGMKLKVAGQNSLEACGYTEVPEHVEFIGYADVEKRRELMSKAKVSFVASMYLEPFGGVQIENLFSGTPTITTDWGSFTDNNIHGVTGYRCKTFEEFVWALKNIDKINPQSCRDWAMNNFTLSHVATMYEEYFQSILNIYRKNGWYELNPSRLNLDYAKKSYPRALTNSIISEKKHPRVVVWQGGDWALGRISQALCKYIPNCDFYDWINSNYNTKLWADGEWKDCDYIISTTDILNVEKLYNVSNIDFSKFIVISHCPRFDHEWFHERLEHIKAESNYGGVSLNTCQEMSKCGVLPHWTPFGVDIDLFKKTHIVHGPVRKLGMIGVANIDAKPYYAETKGYSKYQEICRSGGFEPMIIHSRPNIDTNALYADIDALICCSEFEGGPLGIFEAAACGVPVLTTKVGNAQWIKGIATYETAEEAVRVIQEWNSNLDHLKTYTKSVTDEVRKNWNMEVLIKKHLKPLLR